MPRLLGMKKAETFLDKPRENFEAQHLNWLPVESAGRTSRMPDLAEDALGGTRLGPDDGTP